MGSTVNVVRCAVLKLTISNKFLETERTGTINCNHKAKSEPIKKSKSKLALTRNRTPCPMIRGYGTKEVLTLGLLGIDALVKYLLTSNLASDVFNLGP